MRYSDNATTSALFFNCVAVLLILVGVSRLWARINPRWALAPAEILVVYIMPVIASALGGHEQLQILFTTITWVFRNATAENGWAEEIHPYVPAHLTVSDPRALSGLHLGGSTFYRAEHIQPWIGPLAWWTLLAMALVVAMLCLV